MRWKRSPYNYISRLTAFNKEWLVILNLKVTRPLMYVRNRRGLSTDLHGTPGKIAMQFEVDPLTSTFQYFKSMVVYFTIRIS